jgi:hypothetical protein
MVFDALPAIDILFYDITEEVDESVTPHERVYTILVSSWSRYLDHTRMRPRYHESSPLGPELYITRAGKLGTLDTDTFDGIYEACNWHAKPLLGCEHCPHAGVTCVAGMHILGRPLPDDSDPSYNGHSQLPGGKFKFRDDMPAEIPQSIQNWFPFVPPTAFMRFTDKQAVHFRLPGFTKTSLERLDREIRAEQEQSAKTRRYKNTECRKCGVACRHRAAFQDCQTIGRGFPDAKTLAHQIIANELTQLITRGIDINAIMRHAFTNGANASIKHTCTWSTGGARIRGGDLQFTAYGKHLPRREKVFNSVQEYEKFFEIAPDLAVAREQWQQCLKDSPDTLACYLLSLHELQITDGQDRGMIVRRFLENAKLYRYNGDEIKGFALELASPRTHYLRDLTIQPLTAFRAYHRWIGLPSAYRRAALPLIVNNKTKTFDDYDGNTTIIAAEEQDAINAVIDGEDEGVTP